MRKQTVLSVVAILAVLGGADYFWLPSFLNGTNPDKEDRLLPAPKLAQQPSVPDKSGSPPQAAAAAPKTPEVKKYLEGLSPDESIRKIGTMPPDSGMLAA